MTVGGFGGLTDKILDLLNIRRGKENIPLKMPLHIKGSQNVFGPMNGRNKASVVVVDLDSDFVGNKARWVNRSVKALGLEVAPVWVDALTLVDNDQGAERHPVEPPGHPFALFRNLSINIPEVGRIGKFEVGELILNTINRSKAANIGNNDPALLQSIDDKALDESKAFKAARGAVMNR